MGRTIVIGDVHGCLGELLDLLDKLAYVPVEDHVVLLGDLVDRGPQGPSVVRAAQQLGLSSLLGNHDDRYVRYARHDRRAKLDPSYRIPMRMSDQALWDFRLLDGTDLRWLASLPTMLLLPGGWVAVHAGLHPDMALPHQTVGDRLHIRHIHRESRKSVPLAALGDGSYAPPPGSVYWADEWADDEDATFSVVYGHEVHSLDRPRVRRLASGRRRLLGIDTGCCFGGHLTAVDLADPETWVQVKARKIYENPLAVRPVGLGTP